MIPDEVYDANVERLALERKSAWRDQVPPELDWDANEVAQVVDQFIHQHSSLD
jgi:hypothetical protein